MALHMPRNRNPNFLIADPASGLDHMDPDLQLVSAPHLAAAFGVSEGLSLGAGAGLSLGAAVGA